MKLTKYENNPILIPNPLNDWENLVTTNPAAYYEESEKRIVMLYRAAGNDDNHETNIGLAYSYDGYNFERASDKPLFSKHEGGWDAGSVEDPRIVKFGDYYYITYAAVSLFPGRYWLGDRNRGEFFPPEVPFILRNNETRTGLAITKDFKTIFRPGYLTHSTVDDRDVIIFPEKVNDKFVVLHRPMSWVGDEYGTDFPAIWISYCDDLLEHHSMSLLAKAKYWWEDKIGGAAPPIKTDKGWFMLYHAVGSDKKYRVGAMLLDLQNPSIVLHRTPEPIMEPEHDYEMDGIYKGICFPCGNFVKDEKLFVYYGGADQYVGLATCNFSELINHLTQCNSGIGDSML